MPITTITPRSILGFVKEIMLLCPTITKGVPPILFVMRMIKRCASLVSMIIVIKGMDNLIILIEPSKALLRSPLMCDSFGKPSVQLSSGEELSRLLVLEGHP